MTAGLLGGTDRPASARLPFVGYARIRMPGEIV
jgi:hypothetical protein